MAQSNAATRSVESRGSRDFSMESVAQKHQKTAEDLQRRNDAAEKSGRKVKAVVDGFKEALQRGDIDQAKILEADFKAANEEHRKVTRDVAQVLMALKDSSNDIGIVLRNVQDRNAEEQSIIDAAQKAVEVKESELRVARDAHAQAKDKTFFRAAAVAAAEMEVAKAEQAVKDAKDAVKTATNMAEQKQRERLQNMSLDSSIQELSSITRQVINLATDRIADIEANLAAVKVGREEISESLKLEAEKMKDFDAKVKAAQAELDNLRNQQTEHVENSPEWVDLKTQIEAKQADLTALEAEHNKAFTLLNDGQRFLHMYHLQEQAQQESLGFHQIWIATLESGERERQVLYTSYLGIVKAAGDQKMMADVDAVATQNDEDISLTSAKHLAAMRSSTLNRSKALTGQIKRLADITEADSKSKASYTDGMQKLAEEFKRLYDETSGHNDPQNYMPDNSGSAAPAA